MRSLALLPDCSAPLRSGPLENDEVLRQVLDEALAEMQFPFGDDSAPIKLQ